MNTYQVRLHDTDTKVTYEFNVTAFGTDHAKLRAGAYLAEFGINTEHLVIWTVLRTDLINVPKQPEQPKQPRLLNALEMRRLWPLSDDTWYYRLTDDDFVAISAFIAQGRKIAAIKVYREASARGAKSDTEYASLKESKEVIDAVCGRAYPSLYDAAGHYRNGAF